jgi:site-specific DNA recombinase
LQRQRYVNNELYACVLVWNRQRFIKDPKTGKRVSRPNPEAKWIRTEVELRIVDDELWQRVKLRAFVIARQEGKRRDRVSAVLPEA